MQGKLKAITVACMVLILTLHICCVPASAFFFSISDEVVNTLSPNVGGAVPTAPPTAPPTLPPTEPIRPTETTPATDPTAPVTEPATLPPVPTQETEPTSATEPGSPTEPTVPSQPATLTPVSPTEPPQAATVPLSATSDTAVRTQGGGTQTGSRDTAAMIMLTVVMLSAFVVIMLRHRKPHTD